MAQLKGSSLCLYWWNLPMEESEEEKSGPSGLGAFLGRSEGASGGGSAGDEPQWDGNVAWQ